MNNLKEKQEEFEAFFDKPKTTRCKWIGLKLDVAHHWLTFLSKVGLYEQQ